MHQPIQTSKAGAKGSERQTPVRIMYVTDDGAQVEATPCRSATFIKLCHTSLGFA